MQTDAKKNNGDHWRDALLFETCRKALRFSTYIELAMRRSDKW
jgi:hypothetical protein